MEFEEEAKETEETNEAEEYSDYTEDEMNPNEIAEILGKEIKLTTFRKMKMKMMMILMIK